MSIDNIVLGGSAYWGTNCLIVPSRSFAVSAGTFVPAADGSFTISGALRCVAKGSSRCAVICQAPGYTLGTNGLFAIYIYEGILYAVVKQRSGTTSSYRVEIGGTLKLVEGNDYVFDLVVSTSNVRLYVNGVLNAEKSYSLTAFKSPQKVGLNCWTDADGLDTACSSAFEYYAVNLYDRALTLDEIESNLNAYKERFSLTI